jgi:hypothetical protein
MGVEQSVGWEVAGETEVLGENLPKCQFIHLYVTKYEQIICIS